VAIDSAGNLYIADTGNNVVRMASSTTGIISTVAGGAAAVCATAADSLGDGCPAINAQLNGPSSVALDSAGNLHIADAGDNVVREVSGGAITIVAGNYSSGAGYSGDGSAAAAAQLNGPQGVALDASGNLYIADTGNNVIREVSGGAIQTVAGNQSVGGAFGGDGGPAIAAYVNAPTGLAVDGAGDLFIADTGNNVIREIVAATGAIGTAAGYDEGPGYGGDYGPAAWPSAQLNTPSGVAVDSNGDLYIADAGNNRIRQAQIVAVNYGIMAVGQSSQTYALDFGNSSTPVVSLTGAGADTQGNYLADFRMSATSACAIQVPFPDEAIYPNTPCEADVTFTPQAPGERQGAMMLYDLNTASESQLGVLTTTYLSGVGVAPAIAFPPGVIHALAGNGIQCADPSTQCGDGGPAIAAELFNPQSVAVDGWGNVYIADPGDGVVRKVSASTGKITTFAGTYGTYGYCGDNNQATKACLTNPAGLAMDGAGNLYIAEANNVRMVNWALDGIATVAGGASSGYSGDGGPATSAQLGQPQAVAVDGAGNLYIADAQYSVIREVNASTGLIATIAGTGSAGYSGDNGPASAAQLSSPSGLALDSAGNIYIADSGNNVIREISNGVITTVAGNQAVGAGYSGDGGPAVSAQLSRPTGVAVDAAGDIYIADNGNWVIRQVNAATQTISTIVGGAAAVCSNSSDSVGDGCAATNSLLNFPNSLAVDSVGNIYIADTNDMLVRKVDVADPPSLSFQAYSGSTSGPQSVSVENIGNASLNITTIGVSPSFSLGSSAGDCAQNGQMLSPAQSCQLSVSYTAIAAANATGAVTLTDNALNAAGAMQQLPLSGAALTAGGGAATSVALSASGLEMITTAGGGYQQPAGNSLTLTATVTSAGGTPDGLVSIYDGANCLGLAALNSGAASITISPLAVGAHSITAAYSGSDSYAPSTSSALSYTVVAVNTGGPTAPSLVTISAPTFPLTAVGGSVTQSATVSVVSGAVIFNANSFSIASGFTDYTLGTVTGCATDGVTQSLPGTTCTIPVTFTPSLPGLAGAPVPLARSAPLLINDIENGTPANYAVALSGGGTETLAVISPGVISDLAGNDQTPQSGYAGDGGAPSGAVFSQPQSMAVDGAGNIYIADTGNCTVRKVSKIGNTISTVAGVAPTGGVVNCGIGTDGGAATSSMLNQPGSVHWTPPAISTSPTPAITRSAW
jgi:sugar lactone lactonase YvrE